MATKIKVKVSGGEEPKPLSPQQRVDWNRYVDYVEAKGYKGSKDLDKRETGLARKLFDAFITENPKSSITYEDVPSVQREMEQLRNSAQAFAQRRNDPNAGKIMANISAVDGWPGSLTTQFKFPEMTEKQYLNNSLVSSRDLGLVNSSLQPSNQSLLGKSLPKGVKLERLNDGWYYTNKDGDLIKWSNL